MLEQSERPNKTMLTLFAVAGVVAILAVGFYFLSLRNHNIYRLVVAEGELHVERGRMLPSGFEPYQPADSALRLAYDPIPVHSDAKIMREEYNDRLTLDKALFMQLTGWLRQATEGDTAVSSEDGQRYLLRARRIPSLVDEQLRELQRLEADMEYRKGKSIIAQIEKMRQEAQLSFKRAIDMGTRFRMEAEQSMMLLNAAAQQPVIIPAPIVVAPPEP